MTIMNINNGHQVLKESLSLEISMIGTESNINAKEYTLFNKLE